jgi:hypothetical protein
MSIFALNTEGHPALLIFTRTTENRLAAFAIVELIAGITEHLVALVTKAHIGAAVITKLLAAFFTGHIVALKAGGRTTIVTVEMIFTLTKICRKAQIATFVLFTIIAEGLVALGT